MERKCFNCGKARECYPMVSLYELHEGSCEEWEPELHHSDFRPSKEATPEEVIEAEKLRCLSALFNKLRNSKEV